MPTTKLLVATEVDLDLQNHYSNMEKSDNNAMASVDTLESEKSIGVSKNENGM